jgi:hypothetical protein
MLFQLPGGVTGNTADFGSAILSSNLSRVTNVGFSLTGKVPQCECGEQGSSPGVNHKENAAWCKRQHRHLPFFLRGNHKMVVSSSSLEAAQHCLNYDF